MPSKHAHTKTLEPYQTGENPPTLTFRNHERVLSIPYHDLRFIDLIEGKAESRIEITYDEFFISIRGQGLERPWKELRLFQLLEFSLSLKTTVDEELRPAPAGHRCRIDAIEIREPSEDEA